MEKLTVAIHFETPTLMKELLEMEGIMVKNNKVQQFAELYWDPSSELF